MRQLLIMIIAFSCMLNPSLAQNKSIETSWSSLKDLLIKRSNAVVAMAAATKKYHTIDTSLFKNARNEAEGITAYVNKMTKIKTENIKVLYEKHRHLQQSLGRSLVMLEMHPHVRNDKSFMHLISQLQDLENGLKKAADNYNKQCIESGDKGLLFSAQNADH